MSLSNGAGNGVVRLLLLPLDPLLAPPLVQKLFVLGLLLPELGHRLLLERVQVVHLHLDTVQLLPDLVGVLLELVLGLLEVAAPPEDGVALVADVTLLLSQSIQVSLRYLLAMII